MRCSADGWMPVALTQVMVLPVALNLAVPQARLAPVAFDFFVKRVIVGTFVPLERS